MRDVQKGSLTDALTTQADVKRRQIGGPLLDEIFEQEKARIGNIIKGSNVTMALDGWSTRTNDPGLGVNMFIKTNH
jgi:hypothetical protein